MRIKPTVAKEITVNRVPLHVIATDHPLKLNGFGRGN